MNNIPSFADAIIDERYDLITDMLRYGINLNQVDEYGFTYLIEAAIADNIDIAKLLIEYGANVNMPDSLGSTALHWAVENNNLELVKLLLSHRANPNAYNLAGQPVLVMALLRQQEPLKNLLLQNGAVLSFAQDYINTKLLGHMFELVGMAHILDPKNNFVEVDFEGFFLEFSLGLIAESLSQFENHFSARHLRRYAHLTRIIVKVINRAAQLIKFQQYRVDVNRHQKQIQTLMQQEPLIIPIGYEGHAITFVKLHNILVKCDRREDSRLFDNIVFYKVNRPENMTSKFISDLIYEKQSDDFINEQLPRILDLQPITELKIPAQISGNCSWANVEACIPTLFFLLLSQTQDFEENIPRFKNLALKFFNQWREWNRERTLQFCIQSLDEGNIIRKACKVEIITAVLFQSVINESPLNQERIDKILTIFRDPAYLQILQNYIRSYCFEDQSEESKRFLNILKEYGLDRV